MGSTLISFFPTSACREQMASKVYDSSANGLQNARWSCSPFMTILKRFLNHSAPGLADIFPSKHPCPGSGKPLSPFTREAPTCLPASVRLSETEYLDRKSTRLNSS